MAETSTAALSAAPIPTSDELARAAAFTREPFVLDGEDVTLALAPGTARRRALEAALSELDAGASVPSTSWRRQFSLLLGLERLLSQDEPALVDGTVLSAHQVDALSGTLTALLAEAQPGDGAPARANGAAPVPAEAVANGHELVSPAPPGAEELPEELQEDEFEEEPQDWAEEGGEEDAEAPEQPEDPNAARRFWFEHATGAGKTVAALGFVEASRTGGVLILTHRRNLVDQFLGELRDRGYADRIAPPLLGDADWIDAGGGPVTVETYQWFVRHAGNVAGAYSIVICDEAHTALGEKTSAAIRAWAGPVFIGMTATGALIARHVTDLFPTQTSRFDLAQAARRGVIAPLRGVRIPPGPGVRTIAKVPLRRGDVDVEFDQELLAELLDQLPFNMAVADLYKTRFNGVPGVVYAAGVRHAHNVAQAFQDLGLKGRAVSGETPKRELAQILAAYERGDVDVLVNAQLLAEGWNSPRATVCMHLAPTASRRIYQQRVGRVTRRHPGKEAGIVIDFVHPATKHDDPVVTLHSLLDRDVYRGGAIVVGPVRRGRGRRLRVERRVVPVTADPDRRIEVFERELWRIAVEFLDWGEQIQWAALAGARVAPTAWRRARAMLHFDQAGELKRHFLTTAVERNKNPQLRLRALQEITAIRDADALTRALELIKAWPREERREGVKIALHALAEKKIGRRDQANNWIWDCAEMTRELHEEYAIQRWPETKRLLGLLVNSSGGAHARNARRLVHAARQQDRRLAAALLAAALPHTAEAGEVINGARTRMSRKPAALARELLRNFPKGGKGRRGSRRRRKKGVTEEQVLAAVAAGTAPDELLEDVVASDELGVGVDEDVLEDMVVELPELPDDDEPEPAPVEVPELADEEHEPELGSLEPEDEAAPEPEDEPAAEPEPEAVAPTAKPKRARRRVVVEEPEPAPEPVAAAEAPAEEAKPKRTRRRAAKRPAPVAEGEPEAGTPLAAEAPAVVEASVEEAKPKRTRRRAAKPLAPVAEGEPEAGTPLAAEAPGLVETPVEEAKPKRTRRRAAKPAAPVEEAKPKRTRRRAAKPPAPVAEGEPAVAAEAPATPVEEAKPKRVRRKSVKADTPAPETPGNGASSLEQAAERIRDAVLGSERPEPEAA